jgi:hypothetical protein
MRSRIAKSFPALILGLVGFSCFVPFVACAQSGPPATTLVATPAAPKQSAPVNAGKDATVQPVANAGVPTTTTKLLAV